MTEELQKSIKQFGANSSSRLLNLSNAEGEHLLSIDNLLYCITTKLNTEKGNTASRLLFRANDGRKIIVSNASLTTYQTLLLPFSIIKINQSCLVNLRQIKTDKRRQNQVVICSYKEEENSIEETFTISKSFRNHFNEHWDRISISISKRGIR
jgi:hypothetical protein